MFIGILLILIGLVMFLDHLGYVPGDVWDYILPIALVALGASMVVKHKRQF